MKLTFLAKMAAVTIALLGCTENVSRNQDPRILTMGDSMLAVHAMSGKSVSDVLERELGEPVIDRSVMGARVIYKLPISGSAGFNISKQYLDRKWDWVVLNGGGNDLWFGCGCFRCDRKIEKLVSSDGQSGEIPKLINRIRKTGAKVIYVGYLRSPGVNSPIENCKDEGDELESRIAKFADTDEGVHFVSLVDLVPNGDTSFHSFDMIHPSIKGSAAIGLRVAHIIQE
jgi:hypothetical protein